MTIQRKTRQQIIDQIHRLEAKLVGHDKWYETGGESDWYDGPIFAGFDARGWRVARRIERLYHKIEPNHDVCPF